MHFLLPSMSVVYVLTTPILEDGGDDATNVESSNELWDSLEAKYMAENESSKKFLVSNFTNYKMTNSRPVLEQYNELLDFKHTLKHLKEELTLVELGSHLRIEESFKVQDSDNPKGNNVAGPSVVNMVEHNNSSRYNDNKGKHKHHDNTRAYPNKKAKPTCWKCGKTVHIKMDCKGVNVGNKANGSGLKGLMDGLSNSLKGQNIFNKSLQTYESLNDGSILHMGNESTALVHGRGCVDLRLNIVNDNIAPAFMSTSKLNDSILWHARLGHVHFKRMQDMSNDGLILAFDMDTEKWNKKYFVTFIDDASRSESSVLESDYTTSSDIRVLYVLTTPIPEYSENATVHQIKRRNKWDSDDYVCRGLTLKGMYDPLFNIYQNIESRKELWDSFEAKYMVEDASSKKFLVSNFTNYQMVDSRPVMKQYNELLGCRIQVIFDMRWEGT
ncbi:zinc finger, CCHC-type containing protein [Tanacetum coccineum]